MKVYLLWYDNDVDCYTLVAVYASRKAAEQARATAPHGLPEMWRKRYGYLKPNDPLLCVVEEDLLV